MTADLPPVVVSQFGMEFSYAPIPPRPSMQSICEEVARKHGVSIDELRSHRRHKEVIAARHEAMWRCRHETLASLPMIGRALGGRDHTTILNGVRKHAARLAKGGTP